jgi:hypothetical protein
MRTHTVVSVAAFPKFVRTILEILFHNLGNIGDTGSLIPFDPYELVEFHELRIIFKAHNTRNECWQELLRSEKLASRLPFKGKIFILSILEISIIISADIG